MQSMNFKKSTISILLCGVITIFAISCSLRECPMNNFSEKEVKLIPKEVLWGNPDKLSPKISPDGKLIAYLAPHNDVLNVWIKTSGKVDDKVITDDESSGIHFYLWAPNGKQILFFQDNEGDEKYHLYGVNLENNEVRDYTPFENVTVKWWILGWNKNIPNNILFEMNKEDPRLHDMYNLNLTTGELKLAAKNPGNVNFWLPDSNLTVRAAIALTKDGGSELLVRKDENSEWEKLLIWGIEDTMANIAVNFSKDGNHIYLLDATDTNTIRLVKMNIETKEKEIIFEDPQYDIETVVLNPSTSEIPAIIVNRDRRDFVVLDESIAGDIEAVKKLDHGDISIAGGDADIFKFISNNDIWLVYIKKDNGPISYYTFDRKTKKSTFLFHHKSDLNDYTLAEMEPVSFKARDVLKIHGYISYPPGKDKKNLPMVLLVHGGPWWRDSWGYDPHAQWLANRGYACFQINFRGSTGYGKDFLNASNKEWGGKMHDDLVDGVNWIVDQGVINPDKVAIFGGSYGGYAALVGATFTPDLFCCAVDIFGPSSLTTFTETIPPYWESMLPQFYERIGNPETEEEFLKSRSPLFKVDQIKIPMLIAQGANDPRVKQSESDQIVKAMKEKGIEYEYMLFEDEGHGFAKPENRMKFYAAAEKFLAKHLGGRFEE